MHNPLRDLVMYNSLSEKDYRIHKAPYQGSNNRKKTRGRLAAMKKVQSIPVYKDSKLIGYKHIHH